MPCDLSPCRSTMWPSPRASHRRRWQRSARSGMPRSARGAAGAPAPLRPAGGWADGGGGGRGVGGGRGGKIGMGREDEGESGPGALLNLGHAIGHAIESYGGYSRWLRGEAIALGTVAELRATAAMGKTPAEIAKRAASLLASLGLPTEASATDVTASWRFVAGDKKRAGTRIKLPVVTGAGASHIEKVEMEDLRAAVVGACARM